MESCTRTYIKSRGLPHPRPPALFRGSPAPQSGDLRGGSEEWCRSVFTPFCDQAFTDLHKACYRQRCCHPHALIESELPSMLNHEKRLRLGYDQREGCHRNPLKVSSWLPSKMCPWHSLRCALITGSSNQAQTKIADCQIYTAPQPAIKCNAHRSQEVFARQPAASPGNPSPSDTSDHGMAQ